MKLNYKMVGKLNITDDIIDVTDPCYDADVWCRTRKPIIPGMYDCYVGMSKKNRVYTLIILSENYSLDDDFDVEEVGEIGVDAGMAGFFQNKPDYSDEQWKKTCDYCYPGYGREQFWLVDESTPLLCKGFFSQSGDGDGVYAVLQATKNDRIVGYKLEF